MFEVQPPDLLPGMRADKQFTRFAVRACPVLPNCTPIQVATLVLWPDPETAVARLGSVLFDLYRVRVAGVLPFLRDTHVPRWVRDSNVPSIRRDLHVPHDSGDTNVPDCGDDNSPQLGDKSTPHKCGDMVVPRFGDKLAPQVSGDKIAPRRASVPESPLGPQASPESPVAPKSFGRTVPCVPEPRGSAIDGTLRASGFCGTAGGNVIDIQCLCRLEPNPHFSSLRRSAATCGAMPQITA